MQPRCGEEPKRRDGGESTVSSEGFKFYNSQRSDKGKINNDISLSLRSNLRAFSKKLCIVIIRTPSILYVESSRMPIPTEVVGSLPRPECTLHPS